MGTLMETNYAFIDSQNLNLGIQGLGWKLDWIKFRIYLSEQYKVKKAFLFIGYIKKNREIYQFLRKSGFELVFKPTVQGGGQKVKGNCDAELVLHSMIEYKNYDRAIIVSSDGDFYCLVRYLYLKNKLRYVLAPQKIKCSKLLKRSAREKIVFMDELQAKLAYQK